MGLWQKIGRVFAGGAADATWLEAVQRQLVEADFGVAATNETVERLSRAASVDQLTLERIVVEQLGPPAAPLARAPQPPGKLCDRRGPPRSTDAKYHHPGARQWNGEVHVGPKACQAAARGRAERAT